MKNNLQILPQEFVDQLVTLYNQRKYLTLIERAQSLTIEYSEAFFIWNILGAALAQSGMMDKSIEAYKKCIKLNPDYVDSYNNLGVALHNQNKFDEAVEQFKIALSMKPGYFEAHNNLGVVLHDQDKFDEAIKAFSKCISLNPDYTNAYFNLGNVYKDQGELDKSIEVYNKCINLNSNHVEAYNNKGNAYRDQGKLDNAIKAYNKALLINPNFAEANKNLSFSLLSTGKVKEGLNKYEWRWKTKNMLSQLRHFHQPLWDGKESLKGKRILLWCEQGIGDTLNWVSRLSLIASQADHCILECQEKLVPLLKRSFPNIQINAENKSLDSNRNDFDIHLPMGSLYKHFIDEILAKPQVDPYLIPDPVRVIYWKKRLNSLGNGPFVGVSWKSSVVSDYRSQHYPPITEWSSILTIPDVTFVNLQYVDFADDLARIKDEFGVTVHNFEDLDQYNDIDDLAAFSAALDMVVSTKVTPPIITSGVGTLTKIANWRQSTFNNILTNPVSSTLEMFNKDTEESWDGVFNLIAKQVLKLKKVN